MLETCEKSSDIPIIIVTVDGGTKNLQLKDKIEKCLKDKRATLIICFNYGKKTALDPNDPSLKAYEDLAYGTSGSVINHRNNLHNEVELAKKIQQKIVTVIWDKCNCGGQAPLV